MKKSSFNELIIFITVVSYFVLAIAHGLAFVIGDKDFSVFGLVFSIFVVMLFVIIKFIAKKKKVLGSNYFTVSSFAQFIIIWFAFSAVKNMFNYEIPHSESFGDIFGLVLFSVPYVIVLLSAVGGLLFGKPQIIDNAILPTETEKNKRIRDNLLVLLMVIAVVALYYYLRFL